MPLARGRDMSQRTRRGAGETRTRLTVPSLRRCRREPREDGRRTWGTCCREIHRLRQSIPGERGRSEGKRQISREERARAKAELTFSRYPFFETIAAIPQAERRAARVPTRTARALKNPRSTWVVSRPKKWEKMPTIMRPSSVGSLQKTEERKHQSLRKN